MTALERRLEAFIDFYKDQKTNNIVTRFNLEQGKFSSLGIAI